jgi:hypothetical protein
MVGRFCEAATLERFARLAALFSWPKPDPAATASPE